jgi:hypothetical protein
LSGNALMILAASGNSDLRWTQVAPVPVSPDAGDCKRQQQRRRREHKHLNHRLHRTTFVSARLRDGSLSEQARVLLGGVEQRARRSIRG